MKKVPRVVADARVVERFVAPKPQSKAAIQTHTGWPLSRVQQALDWCKAERTVTKDPFMALYENGSWTYGYRHQYWAVFQYLDWNSRYIRTRMNNHARYLDHVLITRARLAKTLTRKQRTIVKRHLVATQGQVATYDLMIQELQQVLTP